MSLPGTGWIPSAVDDDRFLTEASELPEPIIGVYRDFSTSDPVTDIVPLTMNTVIVGADNEVLGYDGKTEGDVRGIKAVLSQGSVYGATLIDTMFVPSPSGTEF